MMSDSYGAKSGGPTISIPSQFTHDWCGEIAVAANEHLVPEYALNAATFTFLVKLARWDAVNADDMFTGLAREQQARMGLSMAMGAALAAAHQLADAQPSSDPTP